MPIILGVIVLFIYYSMFAYDRCVIDTISEEACVMSVYGQFSGDENGEEYISRRLQKYLILKWDTDIRMYSDETNVYSVIKAKAVFLNKTFEHNSRANKHFFPATDI